MVEALDKPRLGSIRSVTYAVADLHAVEEAYTRWLGYRVAARSELPESIAHAWGAPALTGRRILTLAPASGEPVYLRFIEQRSAAGWRALATHGWNVSELVVQDVDALAASFADSPFRVLLPPASLKRFPMIRAMQVLGPAGEALYFTEIGAGCPLELAAARSFVGRVFIVVAGGADLEALFDTYRAFDNAVDPPVATPVRILSLVHDLPPETEHRHGLVRLAHGTLIELDQYPEVTTARARNPGELPAGMAMVTFDVSRLPPASAAQAIHPVLLPDCNARAAIVPGAAGELIELMESDDV